MKKKETHSEVNALEVTKETPMAELIKDEQKALFIQEVARAMSMRKDETETNTRTEEIISPAVTRPIDLYEKNDKGQWIPKRDDLGNAVELGGALGNIPDHQMPYIQMSNFNSIYIGLEDGIYQNVYETTEETINNEKIIKLKLDDNGLPVILYKKFINVGDVNRERQLNANLAYESNRVKIQGQILVGNAGGSPLGVGGSWDETLRLLFGSGNKK
jgi:hypothetical protein